MEGSVESRPPADVHDVGGGDFGEIGEQFLVLFRELCGLQPHEHVLDVGCGIGRMALPLTKYLSPEGRYEGFDIARDAVDWCRENITPAHPNFRFHFADIFNGAYNPNGQIAAKEYTFPFGEAEFDFVYLTSVFTHMLPDDVENYLSEISRVLKSGARCFITICLLNEESLALQAAGKARVNFTHDFGVYRSTGRAKPEVVLAYDEDFIFDLYTRSRLRIRPPIYYGAWAGREVGRTNQDIIIAEPAPSPA
jgi:SAM-dependent methyltransferase